jgi:2-iminobutanoate/2-iminopropanoate deaminase
MRRINSWVLAVSILAGSVFAQEREMIIPVPQSAYSQAVKIKGGALVFLSGVGPADEKGVLVAPGDFPGQVRATWENMRRVLAKAGGSLDDIVTMTVYTTERRWGDIFTDMRKEVFKTGYPSSAFMEARKLKTPWCLVGDPSDCRVEGVRGIGVLG